jgi:hypothetical protein
MYRDIAMYILLIFLTMLSFSRKIHNRIGYPSTVIVTKHNNKIYNNNDAFLFDHPTLANKKLVSISPGGFKGFYMLGLASYIKHHYNTTNYIFSGASAGAWNSLLMTYRYDIRDFKNHIADDAIQNAKSISEVESLIKQRLLRSYNTEDFDLDRLFIGVTTFSHKPHTSIYTQFVTLEDAIDCCIASSHIPLITGNLTHIYNNLVSFDGGFSRYPYLGIAKPVLHIYPSLWRPKTKTNHWKTVHDYTTLFSKDRYKFSELYDNGYNDAEANRAFLDSIFL